MPREEEKVLASTHAAKTGHPNMNTIPGVVSENGEDEECPPGR